MGLRHAAFRNSSQPRLSQAFLSSSFANVLSGEAQHELLPRMQCKSFMLTRFKGAKQSGHRRLVAGCKSTSRPCSTVATNNTPSKFTLVSGIVTCDAGRKPRDH